MEYIVIKHKELKTTYMYDVNMPEKFKGCNQIKFQINIKIKHNFKKGNVRQVQFTG